jgi:hypothetical protein
MIACVSEHGTNAGYSRHRRRGEEACDECKRARSAYEGTRRAGSLAARRQNRRYKRIEDRALRELASRHPEEYHMLYAKVRRELSDKEDWPSDDELADRKDQAT